jgi:hypothetical protein
VGVGSFAATLVAATAGWKPQEMYTSDITLYSSIVGVCVSGGDLAALGITLDGNPLELPDGPLAAQGAHALWVQLKARMEARPDAVYWQNVIDDLNDHQADHTAAIRKQLDGLMTRLKGIDYCPMDMWEHAKAVLDDEHAVLLAAPPTYTAGFERFFDTHGRLGWDEPAYDVFDPETGFRDWVEMVDGAKCLSLCLQEGKTRQSAHPKPVFARPNGPGRTCYVLANRPEEIFGLMGGPKVAMRTNASDIEPSGFPPLPFEWEPHDGAKVQVFPVKSAVADYYRGLWMHRLTAIAGPANLLVILDGYAAGIIGYSIDPISRPYSMQSKWGRHILLRFAIGAPHSYLRATRLATLLALQRGTARVGLGPGSQIFYAASNGLVTVEYTKRDEAKGLRGLMKREAKEPHEDGYKLTYAAPWQDKSDEEVLADFLTKEARWRSASTKSVTPATR